MTGSVRNIDFTARGKPIVDPTSQLGIHQQFMTQQLRDVSDVVHRSITRQDRIEGKIDDLASSVGDVALRVAVIEAASLAAQVSLLGSRIVALETSAARSDGEKGVWAAIAKSPAVGWLAAAAAAVWLYATKLGEVGSR